MTFPEFIVYTLAVLAFGYLIGQAFPIEEWYFPWMGRDRHEPVENYETALSYIWNGERRIEITGRDET